jgi:NAD(P)H-dependent FMN reductase
MLDAVLAGARDPACGGPSVVVREALQASAEDVLAAQGLILGTPENFGYMSGGLKDFFDRIYYPCLEHTRGLPYGLFIRGGNDGSGALGAIERIVTGLGWRSVAPPVILAGQFEDARLDDCVLLGQTLAAGLGAGVF